MKSQEKPHGNASSNSQEGAGYDWPMLKLGILVLLVGPYLGGGYMLAAVMKLGRWPSDDAPSAILFMHLILLVLLPIGILVSRAKKGSFLGLTTGMWIALPIVGYIGGMIAAFCM